MSQIQCFSQYNRTITVVMAFMKLKLIGVSNTAGGYAHACKHTHTFQINNEGQKSYTRMSIYNILNWSSNSWPLLLFFLVSPQCTWAMLRMVRFISTGLLYLLSPVKSWARLLLMWCNTFMSSHLSCIMLQSAFSSSLIQWHPTYTCSSLPIGTCIIP